MLFQLLTHFNFVRSTPENTGQFIQFFFNKTLNIWYPVGELHEIALQSAVAHDGACSVCLRCVLYSSL